MIELLLLVIFVVCLKTFYAMLKLNDIRSKRDSSANNRKI